MDKDRIAGGAKHVKGSVKESIGKVTGDRETEAEGAGAEVPAGDKSAATPDNPTNPNTG